MREINVKQITEKVRDLCIKANTDLGEDVLKAFDRGIAQEESSLAVEILKELKENARLAKEEQVRHLSGYGICRGLCRGGTGGPSRRG